MTLPPTELVYTASAALCAGVGAATDLRTRRIPNWLTASGCVAGLCLHTLLDGPDGLLTALAAGLLCGGLFVVLFLAGGMGAGDVKLMAAAGCLAGWSPVFPLLLFTVVSGGFMALVFAVWRGQLRVTLRNVLALAAHHRQQGLVAHPELHVGNPAALRLPYGVAIAVGCGLVCMLTGTPFAGAR